MAYPSNIGIQPAQQNNGAGALGPFVSIDLRDPQETERFFPPVIWYGPIVTAKDGKVDSELSFFWNNNS